MSLKIKSFAILAMLATGGALAGQTPMITSQDIYETQDPVPLSDRATHEAADTWLKSGTAPNLVGTNGKVMYPYGQSRPTITCAPLHVCVINLQQGEHITNISIGDSVRWLVQPADAGGQPVLVVKPTVAGLVTNLVVTTKEGRVYYLGLVSDKKYYVPEVGFYDPQQLVITIQSQAVQDADAKKNVVATLGNVDPSKLDFDYSCKSDDEKGIKPIRVFAGSGHTYLQMPSDMKYGDAPAVFNMVDGKKTELINSRLVNGYFIIDGMPRQFKLATGVGDDATTTCEHNTHSGFWN